MGPNKVVYLSSCSLGIFVNVPAVGVPDYVYTAQDAEAYVEQLEFATLHEGLKGKALARV